MADSDVSSDDAEANDDDGWYDDDDDDGKEFKKNNDVMAVTTKKQMSPQERELESLRLSRSSPTTPMGKTSNFDSDSVPPERDTFIPIFTLVAIAGLVGSYTFEMARLYSKGELYLPWNT